jgi:hypothetical protein
MDGNAIRESLKALARIVAVALAVLFGVGVFIGKRIWG